LRSGFLAASAAVGEKSLGDFVALVALIEERFAAGGAAIAR